MPQGILKGGKPYRLCHWPVVNHVINACVRVHGGTGRSRSMVNMDTVPDAFTLEQSPKSGPLPGVGRWSAKRKLLVVLELLRGADLESTFRKHRRESSPAE